MRYISAIPAYGRDYTTKKAVLKDWNEGEDFLIQDYTLSGYVSIWELKEGECLNIRYKKLTQVCVVKGTN